MNFTCAHVPPQIEIVLTRNPKLPKILILLPPSPPPSLFAIHWGFSFDLHFCFYLLLEKKNLNFTCIDVQWLYLVLFVTQDAIQIQLFEVHCSLSCMKSTT